MAMLVDAIEHGGTETVAYINNFYPLCVQNYLVRDVWLLLIDRAEIPYHHIPV